MDAPSFIDKLAKTTITGYLAHLIREEGVDQNHFLSA